ncbi:putative F-box protein [Iris pallida]|uniref:F-box protein n=1 Tax=Iris pallida TaxID=29817 RepID=A0AAX6EY26_IRIPA|nr:putative F-box protein [Iris pallida]
MSIAQGESVAASLSSDLFYDILRRLDGATLARAACACADFRSISKEEVLWENVCRSLWPSTNREDVRNLVTSIGGFRKFYADCFPLIVNKDVPPVQLNADIPYPEEWIEDDYYGDFYESESISPSDYICIVDVRYKDKPFYSKVVWGIPDSGSYNGWFYNCPFRIDLLSHLDGDDNGAGKVFLSVADGLPHITSVERERKDGKLWRELNDGIKLSWIIVNRSLKQAVNIASWSPLGGQRHWPTDMDFLLRFGSILPAKNILPCQVAECILVMKFRITDAGNGATSSPQPTLKLTELSMQLEDMGGAHVNGWNSLLVLKEALSCQRSKNYSKVMESCHLYLKAQSELKEEKMRNESWLDRLCIISGIAGFVALCYCIM